MESTLYTTVFLCKKEVPHQEQMRELRGFCYAIGHNLPLPKPLVAGPDETNLDAANMVGSGTREFVATSFEWAIPAVAKGVYQQFSNAPASDRDYRVTSKDVAEFAVKAYLALYCGGEKPFAEIVPASKEITFDGEMYRQIVSDMSRFPLPIRRLEKVWTSVVWNHGAFPNIGGVIPIHLVLRSVHK